jgi:transcriptional regulator GlxA family with amidase domain
MVEAWDELIEPQRFDYIVVVGGLLHDGQKLLPGTREFLLTAAKKGVPLVGLCTGSFILARLGLLDGYEICVSIFHRDEFIQEFPQSNVQSDRMFVIDRDRITCTGGTSVVHVAGHLIEKHCSRAQALKSVRRLAEEQLLPTSAWQPEEVITRQARDGLVREAMLLIERDLSVSPPMKAFLKRRGVSARQLQRRFIADVQLSPREYRGRLRMARARWMVEHTDRSMTDIGLECGFNDGAHFARLFRERFNASPTMVRRQARLAAQANGEQTSVR